MTRTERTEQEQQAYEMGRDAALAAASWVIDGNTPQEHIRRVVEMIEIGDPEASDYFPNRPNLSGEWAGDVTPRSLYEDITGLSAADRVAENEDADGDVINALADAFEEGVSDHFQEECERILRAALDS